MYADMPASTKKSKLNTRKRHRVQQQQNFVAKHQQNGSEREEPMQREDEETARLYDAAQSQLLEEMAAAGLEGSLPMSFGSNKQTGPVRKKRKHVDDEHNEGSNNYTRVAAAAISSTSAPVKSMPMEKVHVKYDSDGEVSERVVAKVEPLVVLEENEEEEEEDVGAAGGGGADVGEVEASAPAEAAPNGVQHQQSPLPVDEAILRFWKRRNQLFYRYDEGILLDHESWYSVTPQAIAEHIAQRLRKCDVVVDPFAGCGGNVIQLALQCKHVIAIDIDPEKVRMAQHNAAIYGVAHKIDWIVGNSLDILPTLQADAVFLSPPWGGLDYSREHFRLDEMLIKGVSGIDLFAKARQVTRNIAYYLPKTTPDEELEALASPEEFVECEKIYLNKHLSVVTAYYGNLAKQPKKQQQNKKNTKGAAIIDGDDGNGCAASEQQADTHSNANGSEEAGQQIETVEDQSEPEQPSSGDRHAEADTQ